MSDTVVQLTVPRNPDTLWDQFKQEAPGMAFEVTSTMLDIMVKSSGFALHLFAFSLASFAYNWAMMGLHVFTAKGRGLRNAHDREFIRGFGVGAVVCIFGQPWAYIRNEYAYLGMASGDRVWPLQGWNSGLAAGYRAFLKLSPQQKELLRTHLTSKLTPRDAAGMDHDSWRMFYLRYTRVFIREYIDRGIGSIHVIAH